MERCADYAQKLLLCRMEDMSEDYWCAGWLQNLEYSLWSFVVDGPGGFGLGYVDQQQADELRQLAEDAGGWWVWDMTEGRKFVPLDEWREMYRRRCP